MQPESDPAGARRDVSGGLRRDDSNPRNDQSIVVPLPLWSVGIRRTRSVPQSIIVPHAMLPVTVWVLVSLPGLTSIEPLLAMMPSPLALHSYLLPAAKFFYVLWVSDSERTRHEFEHCPHGGHRSIDVHIQGGKSRINTIYGCSRREPQHRDTHQISFLSDGNP